MIKKSIRECYQNVLDRESDNNGLEFFSNLIEKDQITIDEVKKRLKESDEYRSLFKITNNKEYSLSKEILEKWKKEFKKDEDKIKIEIKTISNTINFLKEESKEIENSTSKHTVLLIGFNHAETIIETSKMGRVICISPFLDIVRDLNVKLREYDKIEVYEDQFLDMSIFPDNHFDFCYVLNEKSMIHTKTITDEFFERIQRVLKHQGRLLIQFDKKYIKDNKIEKSFEELIKRKNDFQNKIVKDEKIDSILMSMKFEK